MTLSDALDVRITDSCLRDGSHAVRHQLTVDQVRGVVTALDEAGVPVLEVSHGDGLGGSSFTYRVSATALPPSSQAVSGHRPRGVHSPATVSGCPPDSANSGQHGPAPGCSGSAPPFRKGAAGS